MKQEKGKRGLLWLWIVLGLVAALIVTGAVLVGFDIIDMGSLFGNSGTAGSEEEKSVSEIYWNVDRVEFTQDSETGLSTREKGEDGLYHFRLASQGQLMDMATADKRLVNYLDTLDACGLVLDADGLIIEVLEAKSAAVETADHFYVKKVNGNVVTVNSSITMNGLDVELELKESAYIMDVRPGTETLAQSVPLEVLDVVCVYGTEQDPAESIFVVERSETSPLYLRVNRMYDAAAAATSRVPDENGVYTIPFAIGGKVEELKCKDKALVTTIDVLDFGAKCVMGLTFDEEGYINGTIAAATAIRGKLTCEDYNITAINGNQIEATRIMSGAEQGRVVHFTFDESSEIVMAEDGCNHFIGERVSDLQMDDRIVVWTNMDDNALYVKVNRRRVHDAEMYINVKSQYDSTLKETKRQPINGYYVFEMASKGKLVTAKTKDKAIASKIDGDSYGFFGLKVENGIIKAYYNKDCLAGGSGLGGLRYVTEIMGSIVRVVDGNNFESGGNYMLSSNVEIYDATRDAGTKFGSKTTLQKGDRIIAARTATNELAYIYVLDRAYSGCKLYYNITRMYDATKQETTRSLTTIGDKKYYVYDMYCEGKQVQVKVPEKDKDIASAIDEQSAPVVAMKVSGGIVKKAYPANAGYPYAWKVFNYHFVDKIDFDDSVTCYYFLNGVQTYNKEPYKMAENCKIYNVSTVYKNYRGEKSTLKVGDRITALRNLETGELTHIWIIERQIDSPLFMHVERKYDTATQETARVPDEEGYYHIELFADGKIKSYKTKDKAVMTQVDRSYGPETFFCLKLKNGNIIERAAPAIACKRANNTIVSSFDVMKVSGKTVTAKCMRPGQSNTGTEKVFTYNSKTKIYDVSYYSEHRWESVKLKKGDRIMVYADATGQINYIFVMYPMLHENGPISKCTHCNKKVWWEPFNGNFIYTAGDEVVHYYQPADYVRPGRGYVGRDPNTYPDTPRYTAVFDMNGKTLTTNSRNFDVYSKMIVVDTVGGGTLVASGIKNDQYGGNFKVLGGEVTVQDGVTLRAAGPETNPVLNAGGNFYVRNYEVKGSNGNVIRTNVGKVTIKDATLEAWSKAANGSNITMEAGTQLNVTGGVIKGGVIELLGNAKMSWTGGKIESNLSLNGATAALTGIPNFTGTLLTSNGGKVDISKLSTDASISALPDGVFTTESDNIDAYLNVFTPAVDYCTIVKTGKALSGTMELPNDLTANLQFVPGTQLAACPRCEAIVTWKPVTQAEYGEKSFGMPGDGVHIYLAEDIYYTNDETYFMSAPTLNYSLDGQPAGNACFHLNGHNFTATSRNFAQGSYGNLHIMGTGVVSGNGGDGATIVSNTNKFTGGIYLHSGTYTKAAGNTTGVLQINNGGGRFYVGPLAKVVAPEGEKAVYTGNCWNIPTELIIEGTIEGGYIEMIDADPDRGNTSTIVIDGGNIMGGAKLAKTNIIGLRGAAKVGGIGLDLTSGAKITASLLTEGANVVVAANGIFTVELDNVEEQKAFYAPDRKYYPIEIRDGALWTDRDPNAPDFAKEPSVPALPELLSVDNSNLSLDANNQAKCPVCDEVVTWSAITDTTDVNVLEGGKHYYLSEDLTYEVMGEPYIQAPQAIASCLHLNGHNITATKSMAIMVKGTLNIMGNGTVSGNGYMPEYWESKSFLHAATMQTYSSGAVLNVYGGTYVKDPTNESKTQLVNGVQSDMGNHTIGIHGNGGTLNMFEGATFDGTDSRKNVVRAYWGMFNMYGGEIKGASNSAVLLASWSETKAGSCSIYGGVIQAGSGAALQAAGGTTASLYGGKVNGTATIDVKTSVVVAGTPRVSRLNVPTDGKITLGKLTEGADITVSSNGVFTYQCENAETYKQYFKGVSGYVVEVENYALTTKPGSGPVEPDEPDEPDVPDVPETEPTVPALPELLSVDNTALTLDAENKAKCPVCNQIVVWEAITDVGDGFTMIGEKHYYLANDIVYEGNDYALRYPYSTDYARKTACLHLNDHNVTASNGIAIFAGNYLNVMGNGIVSGNGANNTKGTTMEINSTVALVNLYGGTYTKDISNNYAVLGVNGAGGNLNIFESVVVDGRGTKGDVVRNYNGNINIYGGTVYGGNTGACVMAGTGRNASGPVNGTISIYGGLIQAGDAKGAAVVEGSTLNIYGGEIRGSTTVGVGTNVIIAGNPVMNRLVVDEGAKFTVGAMAEGASVTVCANGVFTNPNPNAAGYLENGYFLPFIGFKPITVVDNALFTEEENGEDPEVPEVPEEPEVPEVTTVDNADLVFAEGTTKAKCPVCNVEVEWIAVTQEANGTTAIGELSEDGKHYYLAEDVVYAPEAGEDGKYPQFLRAPGAGMTACFHLNGHNLTGKNARLFQGYDGVLNIVGNGVVTGDYAKAKEGSVLDVNTNAAESTVNVYGGTYLTMTDVAAAFAIHSDSGKLYVGSEVKVIAPLCNPAIYVSGEAGETAELVLDGCIVDGDITIEQSAANIAFSGVTANVVKLAKNVTFTVSGDAHIEKLDLANGAKITIGELASSAKINVAGDGTISEENANLNTYFGNFTSTYGCELSVSGNALVSKDLNKVSSAALELDAESKAKCPVCKAMVTWTAITEVTASMELDVEGHYYLANDIEYTGTGAAIKYSYTTSQNARKSTCLHLNGHNLTATQGYALFAGNYLNVMGEGTVSGNESGTDYGATVTVNSSAARLNLFGGTYVKAAENTKNPIAMVRAAGGTINVYNGAVIDAAGRINAGNPGCFVISGRTGTSPVVGRLNVYGGEIKNGTNNTGNGGNIALVGNAEFNMYGGNISGGKALASYGGNIYSGAGPVNIMGGTISDGLARMGGNVATSKQPVTIKNAVIKNGVADLTTTGTTAQGGNVSVDRSTLYISTNAQILNGKAPKAHAGNVRCYNTVLTMDGGIVSGGTSKNNNGNIWIYNETDVINAYLLGGLSFTASGEGVTSKGNGLCVAANVAANVDGWFSVIDPEGAAFPGLYVGATASITPTATWFGVLPEIA